MISRHTRILRSEPMTSAPSGLFTIAKSIRPPFRLKLFTIHECCKCHQSLYQGQQLISKNPFSFQLISLSPSSDESSGRHATSLLADANAIALQPTNQPHSRHASVRAAQTVCQPRLTDPIAHLINRFPTHSTYPPQRRSPRR